MLCSQGSGGEGLNIQAANNVIRYGPWWKRSWEDQADARVYRHWGRCDVTHLVRHDIYKTLSNGFQFARLAQSVERKTLNPPNKRAEIQHAPMLAVYLEEFSNLIFWHFAIRAFRCNDWGMIVSTTRMQPDSLLP